MTPYEIPLSPEPQSFTIDLAGVSYQMRVYWVAADSAWHFDLSDATGAPLLLGAPIVTGTDLLVQHAHLGIGGSLLAQTDYDPDAPPTFDNLGITGHLYFVVQP